MTPGLARPLQIFVAHPSELLTDHLSHGDGLVAFGVLRRLAARGHELHVAAQRVACREPLPGNLRVYECAPRGDGTSATDRLVFMVRMRLLFERLRARVRFDVVHQMNPVFTGLSLALLGSQTPLVLGPYLPRWERGADAEGPPPPERRGPNVRRSIGRLIARAQQSRAAALLITSPAAMSRVIEPDRHRGHIFELPHAIDLRQFVGRRAIPARPSILFVAGVARRKGIFTLLEAFDHVAAAIPDAALVIAGGEGGDLEEVRRRVAAMPNRNITLLGAVSRARVQVLLRQHSVYCVPSYGEPVGMGMLEAMACGIPVVATRAGGVPDIVDEAGARLVPPRDAGALAAALIEVLGSTERQRTMGLANRARIESHFEAERLTDRLELAYRTVCAGHVSLDCGAGATLHAGSLESTPSPADGETRGVS